MEALQNACFLPTVQPKMRSVIWTVEYVVQAARMDSLRDKALDGLDQDAEWVRGQNHRPYNVENAKMY